MFQDFLIIELASVLAGPSVGMFFAELGATVIKVENLHRKGDVTRSWYLAEENTDTDLSAYFCSVNWGKESIALDLKSPKGYKVLCDLVGQADMVLSSYLPSVAQKLQVSYENLKAIKPDLIYGSVDGYGPKEERAAFDAVIQAEAGYMYLNGEAGKGMTKMPVALMDVLAAHQLKEALLLAYIHRLRSGEGSHVSISLLDAAISSLVNQGANYLVAGKVPQPIGSAHPNIAPYGTAFTTKDESHILLAVGNDQQFATLCEVLDIEMDPLFSSNQGRVSHRQALTDRLQGAISSWQREALLAVLHARGVPAGAIHKLPEVMEMKQASRLLIQQDTVRGLRSMTAYMPFLSTSDAPKRENTLSRPPHLGEHTDQILTVRLDYSQEMTDMFRQEKVIL